MFNVGGTFNAIKRPVTAALKSLIVTFLCIKYWYAPSAATQTAMPMTIRSSAPSPKL
jgi:hypothetical protein